MKATRIIHQSFLNLVHSRRVGPGVVVARFYLPRLRHLSDLGLLGRDVQVSAEEVFQLQGLGPIVHALEGDIGDGIARAGELEVHALDKWFPLHWHIFVPVFVKI